MPRNRRQNGKADVSGDLAFPVPFNEQPKYLQLANRFLEMDLRRNGSGDVVPINRGKRFENSRLKKAS